LAGHAESEAVRSLTVDFDRAGFDGAPDNFEHPQLDVRAADHGEAAWEAVAVVVT
jgi:hypothetical protein